MKLFRSILVLLSLLLLSISAGNVAWAGHVGGFSGGHGGGFSGGHGGAAFGGHGGSGGGHRGDFGHGYGHDYGHGYGHGYGYGRGYGYYGGYYGGGYFDPWFYGSPWGYDMLYPEVVVTPGYSQAYIEPDYEPQQSIAPVDVQQASPSNDWYYCRNPAGYYPYVKTCPNGWQRVPSTPPQ